ncbi:MAG TPA: HlyD family efflux transporter periplasmic adaptor subunit [Hyphomicrobium sp.]|nr:HlyD family efflux transporter periplasmic adaptor subunit [Hyphomicrobium sp.]
MTRVIALLLSAFTLSAVALAHGDHDHDEPAPAAANAMPQIELAGEDVELVGEVADRTLKIYLDGKSTNAPVEGATIKLTVDGIPGGTATAAGAGTYEIAAPWADDPGVKPLKFIITVGGATTELSGNLTVPEAEHTHAAPAATWATAMANTYTWVIAGLAALFGFVLAFAFRPVALHATLEGGKLDEALPPALDSHVSPPPRLLPMLLLGAAFAVSAHPEAARAHEGHDHAEEPAAAAGAQTAAPRRLPNGDVFLPKPSQRLLNVRTVIAEQKPTRRSRELIGTVVPDPSSFGQVQAPMDGRIELSERGISHVGQRVEAGEVLAYLSPSIPIADLGTMQQLTAEVAGKLKIAEQKLARLSRIAGVVAQKEIDDTSAELDALREQQRVLVRKDTELISLTAPVSGIISVANVRAGQVVTTRDTLFEIVDPHRLWIEAIGGAEHTDPDIAAAHALDPDNHSIKLAFIGRAPSLRQQTQPLQFKVDETHEGLTIGSAVKVLIQQGKLIDGIVLPDSAVVRAPNGLPRVWAKEGPQLFKPLPVRVAPLDGEHVVILDGVSAGERIVVEGAELINQVR